MTKILVVEDEAAIRNNIARLLRLEGYDTATAADGREGLAQARLLRPDILITDIGMPGLDGFALVESVRAEPELATTAILMLTALDDRASMRRGMSAGADDYLGKPFTRSELLEALDGLQKKRGRIEESIATAVRRREELLRRAFTQILGGVKADEPFGLQPPPGAVPDQVLQATVLFSDIRNFTSLAERLDSTEVAELLTEYFERTCAPVLANGGRYLKFIGDGLMAVFTAVPGQEGPPAARRAVSASLAVALATHEFRDWVLERFGARGLPPFAIGVGLHAGEVTIARLGSGEQKELTPIGDTVNTAARLEDASKELGWTVVASSAVLQAAGSGVQTGAMTSLEVRGRHGFVDVAEIVGLQPGPEDSHPGAAVLVERAADIQEALRINSEMTARAVKGALRSSLTAVKAHSFEGEGAPIRLKDYRLTRKLADGGMSQVYLAEREEDGLPAVLKVLAANGTATSENLARFIQEYALLSRIADPHVTCIYDQGFSDDLAYIAMEYFERGDLRRELRAGMDRERVLQVTLQLARALEVIHGHGIIHRDLKPENVMVRADGSVALADFGVAKSMLQQDQLALTQTRHGDVVGTPFYLSPEQAAGRAITPASDLYSLGVMLYEMLTGSRPYQAETLDLLLARHLTAPVPSLPLEFEGLQPVLDRLMAKQPADRYASAGALIADLRERPLLRTLAGPAA
ncbi:protein kinase [Ramlibacter sp. G-1-2-2]|uniref:Protein kinase n=1 Tax=Ramlibacter agri TaxID=2728837 RepID=A0A848HHF3_9BURK|nr:protein kinase [Ramlibacter agri]NML47953.1 protein kinase [Ramlibacter agri]